MPGPLANKKREAFCQHYVLHRSASAAAKHIGMAEITGKRLLKDYEVAERIAELEKDTSDNSGIDRDRVMQIWWSIATLDANHFSQNRVGPCRYCHGIDNLFQWKTPREFSEAVAEAVAKYKLARDATHETDARVPSDDGGYGYRISGEPRADCPECSGLGVQYQVFPDTTKLSKDAAFAYQGTEVTRNGIKVNFSGKADALASIAKAIGMFNDQKPLDVTDSAKSFLEMLMGSKAPLSK